MRSWRSGGWVTAGSLELVLITDYKLPGQIRQLVGALGLIFGSAFSRCLRCNTHLESLDREEARPRVPPYVYSTQEKFMECPQCRRRYWRGTHRVNMRRDLTQALQEVA